MRTNLLLAALGWVAALYLVDEPVWAARVAVVLVVVVLAWVAWKRAATSGGVRSRPTDNTPAPDSTTGNLPTRIDRPANSNPSRLGIGVTERGPVAWDLNDVPHMLVVGTTNSGKTSLLRGLATEAGSAGAQVVAVDPKRIGLLALRGRAGVREVATSPRAMVDAVARVWSEMHARFELLEAGGSVDELPRLILVIDEVGRFIQAANRLWLAEDRKSAGRTSGTEHDVVGELNELAGMGREGRVHLLWGIQRPDARFLGQGGGDTRDNMRCRVYLWSATEDGASMVFGDASVGRDVPRIPGRGTLVVEGELPVAVQSYWSEQPTRSVLTV